MVCLGILDIISLNYILYGFRDRVGERCIRGGQCQPAQFCLTVRHFVQPSLTTPLWSLYGANRYGVSFADPYTPCFGVFSVRRISSNHRMPCSGFMNEVQLFWVITNSRTPPVVKDI